jgi:hypothetical protein
VTTKSRIFRNALLAAMNFLIAGGLLALDLPAQNADRMLPSDSEARAREILDQSILALGGPAFVAVRDSDCRARYAGFERSGAPGGLGEVRLLRLYPDKSRTEYDRRGDFVAIYTPDKGWNLDRSGVTELDSADMASYREALTTDAHYILRYRLKEPDLGLRYAGTEIVDLKQLDWVEVADRKAGHTIRIGVDRASRLPLRSVVESRDAQGARTEAMTIYSNYQRLGGIQVPFQVSRFRNGYQVSQVFYSACEYDTNVPEELFTRAPLDKRVADRR